MKQRLVESDKNKVVLIDTIEEMQKEIEFLKQKGATNNGSNLNNSNIQGPNQNSIEIITE